MITDVLVIGSGIAGLSYAIELAERRKDLAITIISKREAFESNTRYAQGGIAVVQDFAGDSFEKHVADTLAASDGLADLKVVEKVVKQGPDRLKQLMRWGAEFDRLSDDAALELGKEGGHNAHRIVHHKDRSGFEIQRALIERLQTLSNISLLENHTLVDLITDHHHDQAPKQACYGAYVISLESLSVIKINAQVTVLSTGGAGQVYAFSTNPESATGDGIAAAYRAKVRIENLHYVQFHPTALAVEVGGAPFLISEAVRGFGGHLLNDAGQRFVFDYDPRGELASRDIVSRAIELEMKKQGSSHVHLSLKHLEAQAVLEAFPSIAENCSRVGIDISSDLIPVRPAAHYFCGGIDVGLNAKTSLARLYAIGECSHTGLHGANRLASNSLLEALVYAHSAVESTLDTLTEGTFASAYFEAIPEWNHAHSILDRQSHELSSLKKGVQQLMSDKVGIFKTTASLTQAEKELAPFYLRTQAIYSENKLTPQLLELRNMVNVAYLIIKQAQQATENKGVFYNHDYA